MSDTPVYMTPDCADQMRAELKELATEHELPGLILDWRELAKLKSTYVDSLPAMVNVLTQSTLDYDFTSMALFLAMVIFVPLGAAFVYRVKTKRMAKSKITSNLEMFGMI